MEASMLDQIKKHASTYLQEKLKNARLILTDVTEAELLAEEATNNYPCSPDARTMTRIAEATFDFEEFWRVVDILHRRLRNTDWKQWRESYNSLVLLEFLLTHGPEDFADAFQCDVDFIQELGTFKYVDETGFNWGVNMQKKSERILRLLEGGEVLKQARLKALKISKEIQGFGNLTISPLALSPSSSSSSSLRTSHFGSHTTSSREVNEVNESDMQSPKEEIIGKYLEDKKRDFPATGKNVEASHLWNRRPVEDSGSLLDLDDEEDKKNDGFLSGIYSKIIHSSPRVIADRVPLKSLSDVGRTMKRRIDRQLSAGN